ncbi:MAG: hypothetical protein K2G89_02830, partial [Lachnospiraceae bacterium]|nr:hypothetical protein [Lachnospiraceae bacterium]
MKRKKWVLYYAIVFVVIICGFFIGSEEKVENHGYQYYYGERKAYPSLFDGGTVYLRDSEEIGDLTKTKIVSWYIIPLKISHKYFAGILELDYDIIKKAIP